MVPVIFRAPWWFYGVDGIFGAVGIIVTFLVLLLSYKAYKITKQKKYLGFGLAFLFLTLSFIIKTATDLAAYFNFSMPGEVVKGMFGVSNAFISGYVTFLFLSLLAYVVLATIAFKIKDKKLILMLFLITVPSVVYSENYFLTFYLLSSILLAFISLNFYQNYLNKKSACAFLVFICFFLLLLAHIQSIVGLRADAYYVTGRATELLGFIALFVALINVIRK